MELSCPSCGAVFETVADRLGATVDLRCRECGSHLSVRIAANDAQLAPPAQAVDSSSATLFQPRALFDGAFGAEPATPSERPAAPVSPLGPASPTAASSPAPAGADGYFLVLGAEPGNERLRLARARTVFGRAGGGADVELDDDALAPRQFQVDVMGREFYLRELAGGTLLNGREVRFMELLPGDEVAAGATVLVFRAAGDGLGRRD